MDTADNSFVLGTEWKDLAEVKFCKYANYKWQYYLETGEKLSITGFTLATTTTSFNSFLCCQLVSEKCTQLDAFCKTERSPFLFMFMSSGSTAIELLNP